MYYQSHENNFFNEDNIRFLSKRYKKPILKEMELFAKDYNLDDFEYVNMDAFETLEYINVLFIKFMSVEIKDRIVYTDKHPKYIIDGKISRIDTDLPQMDVPPPGDVYISDRFSNRVKRRETYLYKRNYDKDEQNFKDGLESFNTKLPDISKNKYKSSESHYFTE